MNLVSASHSTCDWVDSRMSSAETGQGWEEVLRTLSAVPTFQEGKGRLSRSSKSAGSGRLIPRSSAPTRASEASGC